MKYFFELRQNPISQEWAIIAPRRSRRPDLEDKKKSEKVCPFCPGNEQRGFKELYRVGEGRGKEPGWEIRVIANKFPFAPIHELFIHTPVHNLTFSDFSLTYLQKIFKTYQARFRLYEHTGQPLIFHNHGHQGGESIPHSHTQLAVMPKNFLLEISSLGVAENIFKRTNLFELFCPCASSWPGEVWIAPKKRRKSFGEASNEEIKNLAHSFSWLLKRMERVFEKDFPFNFYIYPGFDWYLRLIPRYKQLGGFEVATGVFVNGTEPERMAKMLS